MIFRPEEVRRNNDLLTLRHAQLADIAQRYDVLARALCHCTDPECGNRTARGITVGRLLGAMVQEWITEVTQERTVDRMPLGAQREMEGILTEMGDDFGLWESVRCDCGREQCGGTNPRAAPPPLKLHLVEEAWRVQGGCRHVTRRKQKDLRMRMEWNRRLLDHAGEMLSRLTPDQGREALGRYQELLPTCQFRESNERIAHCLLDHWGESVWSQLQNTKYTRSIASAIVSARIPGDSLGDFMGAISFLGCGLAATGLAHPQVTTPFLYPFAHALDSSELLAETDRG